jgi:hypothetical protein
VSATLATLTIDNSTTAAPLLLRAALPASFGGALEISVRGTQASGSVQTITADLGLAISVKRLAERTPKPGFRGRRATSLNTGCRE